MDIEKVRQLSDPELEATAQATLRQLSEKTATVSVERASTDSDRLAFDVSVRNLAGHKLPITTKFVVKEGLEHGHQ